MISDRCVVEVQEVTCVPLCYHLLLSISYAHERLLAAGYRMIICASNCERLQA